MDKTKATGYDNITPKILKVAADELAFSITNLINLSTEASCFPGNLKKSELPPLFKANGSLLSENYRPLSILPSISKVFENVFNQQLYEYFTHILSDLLSAFRKKYGCQHVLTKLIEDSKSALDKHMHVGLLLLDLSKAFDCLPHRLLWCKLHAYGVSRGACSLLHSYLNNPFQRVKISASRSDCVKMTKGVPQGSILGLMLFNIFTNDLIYVLNDVCPLYSYADDNTRAFFHSMDILRTFLRRAMNCGTRITGQLRQPSTSLHTWPGTSKGVCVCLNIIAPSIPLTDKTMCILLQFWQKSNPIIEYIRKMQYKLKYQAFFYVTYIPSYPCENWQQPV